MLRCVDWLADPDALKEYLYLLTVLQSVTSWKIYILISSFVAKEA